MEKERDFAAKEEGGKIDGGRGKRRSCGGGRRETLPRSRRKMTTVSRDMTETRSYIGSGQRKNAGRGGEGEDPLHSGAKLCRGGARVNFGELKMEQVEHGELWELGEGNIGNMGNKRNFEWNLWYLWN